MNFFILRVIINVFGIYLIKDSVVVFLVINFVY